MSFLCPHPVVRAHVLNLSLCLPSLCAYGGSLDDSYLFAYLSYLVGSTYMYLMFEGKHLKFHTQADVVDTRVQQAFDPHGDRIGGN